MKIPRKVWKRIAHGLVGMGMVLLLAVFGGFSWSSLGMAPAASWATDAPISGVQELLRQGRDYFVRGQLTQAAATLEAALTQAQGENDTIGEAMVLSNLALVYGQVGQWGQANQAIANSLSILDRSGNNASNWQRVRAQVLNVQGRLELGQGHSEEAYRLWEKTADAYKAIGDRSGTLQSQLRQARALQAMGFYRRAVDEILLPLGKQLRAEPPSPIKAQSLRSLAEALTVAESLDQARQVAKESLAVAEALGLGNEIAATQLTLGSIEYAQAREYESQNNSDQVQVAVEQALQWYRQVSTSSEAGANGLRSQLNQLALLLDFNRAEEAAQLWPQMYEQVNTLPPTQDGIYSRINFANSLIRLAEKQIFGAPRWSQIVALLETAQTEAVALQDARATAHVLGYLGKTRKGEATLNRDLQELEAARKLTEDALFQAQSTNAVDISYLWYEQLGDLHVELGKLQKEKEHHNGAIAAYRGAVNTLKSLRSDLTTINPEVQFSFKQSVEPLHRKLVSLLLEGDGSPSQSNLKDARAVLESLQIAELTNYLKAACLNSQEVSVDKISGNQRVAVIYPIILSDRLGIITNLPAPPQTKADSSEEGELKYYAVPVQHEKLEESVERMLRQVVFVDYDVLNTSEELYHLLFPKELLEDLAQSQPNTLVFIPDGVLRNIPIAALFDGQSYLIEKYSVAITPGLQLLNPQPLEEKKLSVLSFGLTKGVAGWSPLPNVAKEIDAIKEEIPTESFLDENFTFEQFEKILQTVKAPIIHLATHGKFSSQLDETFVQSWDKRISVNDLSKWLQSDRTNDPVELLVLSACETATGDKRAALGLAGMAIRAGARSTVASLWQVDDAATSIFMTQFYQALSVKSGNKAEALQTAQKYLIENYPGDFDHPYYWAPFVLIGNWL